MHRTRGGRPIPRAVASQAAHQFGHDVVITLALSHDRRHCTTTVYGRTADDQATGERLADLWWQWMREREEEQRNAA